MPQLAITTLWIMAKDKSTILNILVDFVNLQEWCGWRLSPNPAGILMGETSALVEVFGDIKNDYHEELRPPHVYGPDVVVEKMPCMGIIEAITQLRKTADQAAWN